MPGVVLRHSNIPPTVYSGDQLITTGQLFALWRTIRELSKDSAAGWKLMSGMESAKFHPTLMVALHARNYRECLERHARYKQLCSAQEFRFTEKGGEFQIETSWPFVPDERPPALMIDAVFAILVELGRRGTMTKLSPKRLELSRPEERDNGLEEFFGCPVKYGCSRDKLVLSAADVELPFVTHNEELVQMLAPQFEHQLNTRELKRSTIGSVKWVLRRLLSGSRPDVAIVAKELGMSERTLQRRITEEGMTFRQLLNETRKELIREYLTDESVEITEAAFLVGFENANSFYRAFRSWEGKTPAEWRAEHRGTN
jgi:AraC-like DNA-binding protein